MADDKNTSTFPMLGDASAKTASPTPAKPTQPKVEPKKEVKRVEKNGFDYTNCKTYTVKEGQTLLDVANEVLVAYQQLRYFNGLPKNNPTIKAGQVIYIPNQAVDVPLEG